MKITPVPFSSKHSGAELEKRFYMPFIVTSACPKCGREDSTDLRESYLSYPTLGKPEDVYMCHADAYDGGPCQNEWKVQVVVGLTLTAHEPKKRSRR